MSSCVSQSIWKYICWRISLSLAFWNFQHNGGNITDNHFLAITMTSHELQCVLIQAAFNCLFFILLGLTHWTTSQLSITGPLGGDSTAICRWVLSTHDGVIKWKHFPRYWPFVRGIHRSRPVTRSFDVLFDLRLDKRWGKQLWGWWFETQSCPLWRHYNKEPEMGKWHPYHDTILFTDMFSLDSI